MADLNGSPLPGAGNPDNASGAFVPGQQNAGEQAGQDNQQFLTVDQARELFNSLFDSKAESISAKTANRVKRVISAAQQQGIQMTAAQAQNLIQEFDALQQEQQQPGPQAGGKQPTQGVQTPQPGPAEQLDPVILTAMSMMDEAGVQVEDGDPELALIDQQTKSPKKFLDSVERAIEAKKQRLAQALPARMPTVAGGSGGMPAGGKNALLAQIDQLMKESPTKNWVQIKELREQLKQYR